MGAALHVLLLAGRPLTVRYRLKVQVHRGQRWDQDRTRDVNSCQPAVQGWRVQGGREGGGGVEADKTGSDLYVLPCAPEVLVKCFEPPGVIVGVWDDVHIQLGGVPPGTGVVLLTCGGGGACSEDSMCIQGHTNTQEGENCCVHGYLSFDLICFDSHSEMATFRAQEPSPEWTRRKRADIDHFSQPSGLFGATWRVHWGL